MLTIFNEADTVFLVSLCACLHYYYFKHQVAFLVFLVDFIKLLPSGSEIVTNVEYNQLDPLLRATGHADGDVNCETGFSPFPGNINQVSGFCDVLCSIDIIVFQTIIPVFVIENL